VAALQQPFLEKISNSNDKWQAANNQQPSGLVLLEGSSIMTDGN